MRGAELKGGLAEKSLQTRSRKSELRSRGTPQRGPSSHSPLRMHSHCVDNVTYGSIAGELHSAVSVVSIVTVLTSYPRGACRERGEPLPPGCSYEVARRVSLRGEDLLRILSTRLPDQRRKLLSPPVSGQGGSLLHVR